VLVSLLTITVDYRQDGGPLDSVGKAALGVITPLQKAVSTVLRPVGDFFSGLSQLSSLKEENRGLRDQLKEKESEALRNQEALRQSLQWKAIFDLQSALGLETTGAYVIGSGVSNFDWTVTIDKGSAQGVEVDMPVINGGGLVGHIVSVTKNSAQVQLLLDENSAVTAIVRPEGAGVPASGLVEGNGDDDLIVSFTDTNVPIEAGMVAVTAGWNGLKDPPGIPIGVVSRVLPGVNVLEQTVRLRPWVDFSTLYEVAVVLGTSDA
jgi:rod shape-determining protein MreC